MNKKEPEAGVIRALSPAESGVSDAVELMAQTSMGVFEHKDGEITGISSMGNLPCKMMASYEIGTFSISVRGTDPFIVSVRIDELMALLKAATDRHIEVIKKNAPKGEKEGEKHE